MDQDEATTLKKTLYDQCLVMNRLYNELEEERKASATAVEEALSMILRLQVEKAHEMMEACQYKRAAEEKMRHMEEILAVLEEEMYHKDTEIASLKYQLHVFKSRLFSADSSIHKKKSGACVGKEDFSRPPKRNISMPAVRFELLCSEIGIINDMSESICREIADHTKPQLREIVEEKFKLPIRHNSFVLRESCHQVLHEPIAEADHRSLGCLDCHSGNGDIDKEFMDIHKVTAEGRTAARMYHCHRSVDCEINDLPSRTDAKHEERQMQRLEDDRRTLKHKCFEGGDEQLNFSGEMNGKLDVVQPHKTNSRLKEPPSPDDYALLSLMEAMLCFSL